MKKIRFLPRVMITFGLGLLFLLVVTVKWWTGGEPTLTQELRAMGEVRNLAGVSKTKPWVFESVGITRSIDHYASGRAQKFGENAVIGETGSFFVENIPGAVRELHKAVYYSFLATHAAYVGDYKGRAHYTIGGISLNYEQNPFILVQDEAGERLWRYEHKGGGYVTGLDAADMDGDGVAEYVATFGLGDDNAVILFDRFGKVKWRLPVHDVYGVKVIRSYGQPDIVFHATFQEEEGERAVPRLVTVDKAGKALRSEVAEYNFRGGMYFTHWPTPRSGDVLLTGPEHGVGLLSNSERFQIRDIDGAVIKTLAAPGLQSYHTVKGVPFKVTKDTYYFAVLATMPQWERAVLYIYNQNRDLLYQEVLEHGCAVVSSVPDVGKVRDRLMIGCNNYVYQYLVLS